jgi:hypothetical protein
MSTTTGPDAATRSEGAVPGAGTVPTVPTVPTVTPDGTVLGDGTTARSRARGRWRRWRWVAGVVAVLAIGVLAAVLPAPVRSTTPLAPDNPQPNGARAVAQVLGDQGVTVRYVRTTGEAVDAAAGSTLLLTSDWLLSDQQIDAVAAVDADLVLLDPSPGVLARLAPAVTTAWTGSGTGTTLEPGCEDPDALAAGRIIASGSGFVPAGADLPADASLCYPVPGSGAYLYAATEADGRRVVALGDATLLTNASVAQEGNAALVLRALGRDPDLVWYIPSPTDTGEQRGAGLGDLLPPTASLLLLQALVVVVALGLWRGRRLGRVVVEQLPVVVRAAETTRGRGRLYRTSRSTGHAAAALRAGAADRLARRLGLARSADALAVIDAVARASGRDPLDIRDLLYGPPPTSDAGLDLLVRRLDELESEVHPT